MTGSTRVTAKLLVVVLCLLSFFNPGLAPVFAAATINITDFGAAGTDEVDDSAAIEAAIEVAKPGDTVFFPAGTYYVSQGTSEGVQLKSGVTFLGEDGATLKCLADDRFTFTMVRKENIVIDNLTIEGKGILINGGSNNITVQNCTFRNVSGSYPYGEVFLLNDGVHHLYFYNNKFFDNGGCFMGYGVKDSEWIGNHFERISEPIHLIGDSTFNTISNNVIYYYSRIGIEIQDNATGAVIEENDIRYELDPEGMFAISFAAPYTQFASIKNNILVGGKTRQVRWDGKPLEDGNWGAAVEVMGSVTVENNIMIDFQQGCQVSLGYQDYKNGPVLDGPVIRNNYISNPSEYGIWKTHVTDLKNMLIENNFIENPKYDGVLIQRDDNSGIVIKDNVIARKAGFWKDDSQNTYSGIRTYQNNEEPATSITGNYIIQKSSEIPEGFSFNGITFDGGSNYGTAFQGITADNNKIISMGVMDSVYTIEGQSANSLMVSAMPLMTGLGGESQELAAGPVTLGSAIRDENNWGGSPVYNEGTITSSMSREYTYYNLPVDPGSLKFVFKTDFEEPYTFSGFMLTAAPGDKAIWSGGPEGYLICIKEARIELHKKSAEGFATVDGNIPNNSIVKGQEYLIDLNLGNIVENEVVVGQRIIMKANGVIVLDKTVSENIPRIDDLYFSFWGQGGSSYIKDALEVETVFNLGNAISDSTDWGGMPVFDGGTVTSDTEKEIVYFKNGINANTFEFLWKSRFQEAYTFSGFMLTDVAGEQAIWNQNGPDGYLICIKQDRIELHKKSAGQFSTLYNQPQTILAADTEYRMTLSTIKTGEGTRITLKADDVTVLSVLDSQNSPDLKPVYFSFWGQEGSSYIKGVSSEANKLVGISYNTVNALSDVTFANNYFENLITVIKPGATGNFAASGNVSAACASQGVSGFIAGEAENKVPVIDAGADITAYYPNDITVAGSVYDDGAVSVKWEKFIGIGDATFADDSAAATTVSFSRPGWYVLKMTANDGTYAPWDAVLVKVEWDGTSPTPAPTPRPDPTAKPTERPRSTPPPTPTPPPVPGIKLEAEAAERSGDVGLFSNHEGYSGTGFIAGFKIIGDSAKFTVDLDEAGTRLLTIRFANGHGANRYLSLYVNDVKIKQVVYPSEGWWDSWNEVELITGFISGTNIITLQLDPEDEGNFNFDYIVVGDEVIEPADPTPSPSDDPERPTPTPTPTTIPTPTPTQIPTPMPTPTTTPSPIPSPTTEPDTNPATPATPSAKPSPVPVSTVVVDPAKLDNDLKASDVATVVIPKAEGATSYVASLPSKALASEADDDKKIEIVTELGTVTLPTNMFKAAEIEGAANVGLEIALADTSGIDEEIMGKIGDRPVLEIKLKIDDRVTSWNNPETPVTVQIPYTPTEAELQDTEHIVVWYIDGSGQIVSVPSGRYDPETGMVTFTTTHFSKYAVAYVNKSFGDIGKYPWAKRAVEVMASKGVINGTSASEFSPGRNIKRADFIVLLVRALGLSSTTEDNFSDVNSSAHYADAVAIAKKLAVTAGTGNNRFDPEASITRQDMMVLISNALKAAGKELSPASQEELGRFADAGDIAAYAKQSIADLVKNGIVAGDGTNINPRGNASRAEAAVLIYRVYNR